MLRALSRSFRALHKICPPVNFITIHYSYFIATCLFSAVVLWGASTPPRSVAFIDALFLVTSAMTLAGLNTINLSTLNTFQQFMLFALIIIGSAIWVSAFVVLLRKNAFEKKFKAVAGRQRSRRLRDTITRRSLSATRKSTRAHETSDDKPVSSPASLVPEDGTPGDVLEEASLQRELTPPSRRGAPEMNGISSLTGKPLERPDTPEEIPIDQPPSRSAVTFSDDTRFDSHIPVQRRTRRSSFLSMQGVGARPDATLRGRSASVARSTTVSSTDAAYIPESRSDIGRYFESVGGWVARNSEFHGLTAHEREKLGGYEYRAVSFLAWLVPTYFVLWQLLGCLGCAAWVAYNQPEPAINNGLNPWWVGAFNAVSAFNNSGMSLLDANMTAFQTSFYLLITMGLLILAGNTCYPIFLRLIVWSMHKAASKMPGTAWAERAKTLRFLLDHPRRCYTNLFPAQHTWWLFMSVVTLNGVDWAAYEILNINNSLIEDQLPLNVRVLNGLFQAFAVRSGGFYVVTIPHLRISLLILYVVMMYISVYPVVITMRNSNVYEERSLGIYADDPLLSLDAREDGRSVQEKSSSGSRTDSYLSKAANIANHFIPGRSIGRGDNTHFVRQQLRAQLAHDAWWIVLALFLIMIIENQRFVDDPVTFSVFNFIFEIVSGYGCVGISVGVPWDSYSFAGSWQPLSKLILCAVMLRGRHRGLPVAIDKAVLLPGQQSWEAEEDDGRIRIARTMSRGRQETV